MWSPDAADGKTLLPMVSTPDVAADGVRRGPGLSSPRSSSRPRARRHANHRPRPIRLDGANNPLVAGSHDAAVVTGLGGGQLDRLDGLVDSAGLRTPFGAKVRIGSGPATAARVRCGLSRRRARHAAQPSCAPPTPSRALAPIAGAQSIYVARRGAARRGSARDRSSSSGSRSRQARRDSLSHIRAFGACPQPKLPSWVRSSGAPSASRRGAR